MQNPLFIVFLVPVVTDIVGTVTGQDKKYWQTKYKKFDEAVPFIYILLKTHPLLFIAGCLVIWLPITYFLILKLPEPLNIWASLSLLAGHSYNSVTWFRKTQRNLNIFAGKDRISITLSLIPMSVYILFIGYLASVGILAYFGR